MRNGKINELETKADEAFAHLLDYVYKSPDFLRMLDEKEGEKARAYYPDDPEGLKFRTLLESVALFIHFPQFMASANLILCVSMFERFVVRLDGLLKSGAHRDTGSRGNVLSITRRMVRLDEHLPMTHKDQPMTHKDLPKWAQVEFALRLRNAFAHAGGLLDFVDHSDELRQQIERRDYLGADLLERQADARRRGRPIPTYENYVVLIPTPDGEQIWCSNKYVHVACADLRDYFRTLCDAILGAES